MAQAKAKPSQAPIPGFGFGLKNMKPKPKPDEAKPKPGLASQAKPKHHYLEERATELLRDLNPRKSCTGAHLLATGGYNTVQSFLGMNYNATNERHAGKRFLPLYAWWGKPFTRTKRSHFSCDKSQHNFTPGKMWGKSHCTSYIFYKAVLLAVKEPDLRSEISYRSKTDQTSSGGSEFRGWHSGQRQWHNCGRPLEQLLSDTVTPITQLELSAPYMLVQRYPTNYRRWAEKACRAGCEVQGGIVRQLPDLIKLGIVPYFLPLTVPRVIRGGFRSRWGPQLPIFHVSLYDATPVLATGYQFRWSIFQTEATRKK
ncbi:hypothetical protein DFH06DRAFT_1397748 [Mycena polygramma]|nr:hypothetical protein DFH06DRAFT_1397748 [Mycena polygramma]